MTAPEASGKRIGFVGLGNMGAPMSANIAGKGFALTVFDTNADLARRHASTIGAGAAASLSELGAASDIIVTMLPTGQIVRQVLLETDGGLASFLGEGALVIDMSSSDPVGSRELAPKLAERGIGFIDAPVSGAVPRAITGKLAIMAGCDDPETLERARPVLEAMGETIFETGGVGTGHAMKALNNYVAAAGFAAASEALILAERFGLDPGVAIDIMNVSTGRNFSTESTIKSQVLSGAFASGFQMALLTKDVKIAAELSRAMDARLPLVAETSAWWTTACEKRGGQKDHTEAYSAWKEVASRSNG